MYNPPLENIKIAAPCTADWKWMYGNDRVRFCSQCNLNVYNLSALSREQAEDLLRSAEGRLCVRFYRRKDGSILTQNCPQGLQAIKEKFNRTRAKVAAALLTFLGSLGLLWWMTREPSPPLVMTGLLAEPSVRSDLMQVNDPPPIIRSYGDDSSPEMGGVSEFSTVERSEKVIRKKASFKVMPAFHSEVSSEAASSPVVVHVTISPAGDVTYAKCLNEDPSIRGQAEEAAYRWKFQPRTTKRISTMVNSVLTFRLAR